MGLLSAAPKRRKSVAAIGNRSGFTLLEVLAALTIVSLILGSLLAQLGGSKRLGGKARQAVSRTIMLRALVQAVELDLVADVRKELEAGGDIRLTTETVRTPARKTRPSRAVLALETVTMGKTTLSQWHWERKELPR